MKEHSLAIIDDEQISRDSIRHIIQTYCPHIQIVGEASSVQDGIGLVLDLNPEIITLDIDLGDGTGFDLLGKLENPPKIVFITGHDDRAIQAFKANAVDYILKPFEPFELIEAVKKSVDDLAKNNKNLPERSLQNTANQKLDKLILSSLSGFELIDLEEVEYIESENNYSIFHLIDKSQKVASKTLKHYEDLLSNLHFFRCHQSFLVNYKQIREYQKGEGGTLIMQNGASILVSRRKKEELLELLQQRFIR